MHAPKSQHRAPHSHILGVNAWYDAKGRLTWGIPPPASGVQQPFRLTFYILQCITYPQAGKFLLSQTSSAVRDSVRAKSVQHRLLDDAGDWSLEYHRTWIWRIWQIWNFLHVILGAVVLWRCSCPMRCTCPMRCSCRMRHSGGDHWIDEVTWKLSQSSLFRIDCTALRAMKGDGQ